MKHPAHLIMRELCRLDDEIAAYGDYARTAWAAGHPWLSLLARALRTEARAERWLLDHNIPLPLNREDIDRS